jgi:hypothetical protein
VPVSQINNATTADDYEDALTLERKGDIRRVTIDVSNAAVYYALGWDWPPTYSPEVFLKPGNYSLDRTANGCKVRSAAAGTPAQVMVELLTADEIGG